jgi:hypothetical protein
MEKPNHGLEALYQTAQGQYVQRTFATIKRDFQLDPALNPQQTKYKNDPLFLQHLSGSAGEI